MCGVLNFEQKTDVMTVLRSTINTNSGTELTLKCKLKCYEKPMKDPLGIGPSKGNQGTTRGKGLSLSDLIAQSAE